MDIKIYNLKLRNFKGIKELEINFDGKDTNIYGKNATGKTTIFDAFKWLFFNKDSNDKTDFNIKTLDKNNEPIHFLEHEVEATLIIDGQDVTFRKMLKEKWIKKRGKEKEEYAGSDEKSYWIDEVPVKEKDYKEKINDIIPESLFKLITDPLFFNEQMEWKERRKILTNVAQVDITDEEMLTSMERFELLKENLKGRTIEGYKKTLKEQIKKLEDEKKEIPIAINTLTGTLIKEHNIDYEELEKEKISLNEELQKIEIEMTDIQLKSKENMKKTDELAIAKNELNNLKFKLETEHSNRYSSESIKLNNEKLLLENNFRNKKQEYEERKLKIEQDNRRKEELYKKWDEVNNMKLEFDPNSFICPVCKREYETDRKEEIKQKLKSNFNVHKKNEQDAINKEGQSINVRIEENTNATNQLQTEIKEIDEKLKTVQAQIVNIENQKTLEETFDVNSVEEYQEKQKQVDNLQEEVNKLISIDITEIQSRRTDILKKIEDVSNQLARKTVEEEVKTQITELEKKEEDISQKIQELEAQEYQIEDFTRTKVKIIEETINSKFELVKFRMFKKQKNEGVIECCDALVNGVPYADVNNAHKILAGLDIINTLSKFYKNTTAPIFIDNRESINNLCQMNTQIISLVVTEDPELRIEVL